MQETRNAVLNLLPCISGKNASQPTWTQRLTTCSCEFSALKIFGYGDGSVDMDGDAGDVLYASYLSMARAGLMSVEFWDPKGQKWGQPHCQARFAILKV